MHAGATQDTNRNRRAIDVWLRYDLRSKPEAGISSQRLFEVALEQVEWADKNGFNFVLLPEHHGTDDGYNPSPFVLGAAMAARSSRIRINIGAVLLPLHDPIRVAEDALVLDNISNGRVELTAGIGYVEREFSMFGRSMRDRAARADEGLQVLRKAFTGEPFKYHDHEIQVTPRAVQAGGPPLYVGGAVKASALRAARYGDGFFPTLFSSELLKTYTDECTRLERPLGRIMNISGPVFIHVTDDPERARAQIGPFALYEMNAYARWKSEGKDMDSPFEEVGDVDAIWKTGLYRVVTPEQCLALAAEQQAVGAHLTFTPLLSGLDPDLAWASLELFRDQVLPKL